MKFHTQRANIIGHYFKFALKSSYIQESPMALDRSPESWHMMYWSVAKEI